MILKRIIHQMIQIEIKIICFIETYDLEILSLLQHLPQGRKEVLWNVQEPGSLRYQKEFPKKIISMIATLPGGRPFMGDHLEVVCLLQAG